MVATRRNHKEETAHRTAHETVGGAQLSEEAVARRAYELYEQRGAGDGRDWDDWFQAEQELRRSTAVSPESVETLNVGAASARAKTVAN